MGVGGRNGKGPLRQNSSHDLATISRSRDPARPPNGYVESRQNRGRPPWVITPFSIATWAAVVFHHEWAAVLGTESQTSSTFVHTGKFCAGKFAMAVNWPLCEFERLVRFSIVTHSRPEIITLSPARWAHSEPARRYHRLRDRWLRGTRHCLF